MNCDKKALRKDNILNLLDFNFSELPILPLISYNDQKRKKE